jgi:MarR family 2-MHQ and catechol resistance regulon transcriptional repressor
MATKYRGTEAEARALDAYINLMRAANAVTLRVHRHLREADLTLGQFGALEALFHLGPMRQHELVEKLLCSPGNLSTVLTNLERRKLVRRRGDASDARCTMVEVTEKGTRLIEEVFPRHVEGLQTVMGALSAKEQEDLRALCRKLGKAQV